MRGLSRNYVHHIRWKLKHKPLPGVFLDMLSKLGLHVFRYHILLETLPPSPPPAILTALEPYRVGLMGKSDLGTLASLPARRPSEKDLMDRMDQGMQCLGAWSDDQPIAFCWCSPTGCHLTGCTLRLVSGEACILDTYTQMEFRGRGVGTALRYELMKRFSEDGIVRFYSVSNRYNASSLRMKAKLGARVVYSGTSLQLLGRWCRTSGPDATTLASIRSAFPAPLSDTQLRGC